MSPLVPGATAGTSFGFGFLDLTVVDFVVIVLMIVVFAIAVWLPPRGRRHRP